MVLCWSVIRRSWLDHQRRFGEFAGPLALVPEAHPLLPQRALLWIAVFFAYRVVTVCHVHWQVQRRVTGVPAIPLVPLRQADPLAVLPGGSPVIEWAVIEAQAAFHIHL